MDNTNELIVRLSTAAGIIMEDASPIAVTIPDPEKRDQILASLEQDGRDVAILIQAAQVLARRDIR